MKRGKRTTIFVVLLTLAFAFALGGCAAVEGLFGGKEGNGGGENGDGDGDGTEEVYVVDFDLSSFDILAIDTTQTAGSGSSTLNYAALQNGEGPPPFTKMTVGLDQDYRTKLFIYQYNEAIRLVYDDAISKTIYEFDPAWPVFTSDSMTGAQFSVEVPKSAVDPSENYVAVIICWDSLLIPVTESNVSMSGFDDITANYPDILMENQDALLLGWSIVQDLTIQGIIDYDWDANMGYYVDQIGRYWDGPPVGAFLFSSDALNLADLNAVFVSGIIMGDGDGGQQVYAYDDINIQIEVRQDNEQFLGGYVLNDLHFEQPLGAKVVVKITGQDASNSVFDKTYFRELWFPGTDTTRLVTEDIIDFLGDTGTGDVYYGNFKFEGFIDIDGDDTYTQGTDIALSAPYFEQQDSTGNRIYGGVYLQLDLSTAAFTVFDPFTYSGNDTTRHYIGDYDYYGINLDLFAPADLVEPYVYDFQLMKFGNWELSTQ